MTSPAKNLTPDVHSGFVGGSTAARRLACPGSYKMEQRVPATYAGEESGYAAEGTALHECIAYLLDNDVQDIDSMIGTTHYGHIMSADLIAEAIAPAVAFFDELCDELEQEGGFEFTVENRCEMPGIPDAFGTSDIIGRSSMRSVIVDWKFGQGVPVYASYPDQTDAETGEVITEKGNPQLMFYGRAAMASHPEMFEKDPSWPVELIIVQPRIGDGYGATVSRFMTSVRDLEAFRGDLVRAMSEATSEHPTIKRGEHCRWAKCKIVCPKFTEPVLDLSALSESNALADRNIDALSDAEYGELLSAILEGGEILNALVKEAQTLARNAIDEGVSVPGWGLKPKKAGHDAWKEGENVDGMLGRAGLSVDDRRVVKPITPAVARTKLKSLGKTLNEKKYVEPGKSSGFNLTRLAEGEDGASTSARVAQFAERIAAIAGDERDAAE